MSCSNVPPLRSSFHIKRISSKRYYPVSSTIYTTVYSTISTVHPVSKVPNCRINSREINRTKFTSYLAYRVGVDHVRNRSDNRLRRRTRRSRFVSLMEDGGGVRGLELVEHAERVQHIQDGRVVPAVHRELGPGTLHFPGAPCAARRSAGPRRRCPSSARSCRLCSR